MEYHHIDTLMVAGLPANQGSHCPTAIQDNLYPILIQQVYEFEDYLGGYVCFWHKDIISEK